MWGKGECGKYKVIIREGKRNLSELTEEERRLLSKNEIDSNYRLACRSKIKEGDILVEVPEESRQLSQIILTESKRVSYKRNPVVKEFPVKITKP